MSNKRIRTLFTSFLVVFVFVITCTATAFAASYSTSWDFSSGFNGRGGVYGYQNGVFYKLNAGTAYLDLTDGRSCAVGQYTVALYINDSWFGLGTYCGSDSFHSAPGAVHYTSYSVPRFDSRYYFAIQGTGDYQEYVASGTFYQ